MKIILLFFLVPRAHHFNLQNCLVGNVRLVGITQDELLNWHLQPLGSSTSLARCVELCCSDTGCSGALLYNQTCFVVACSNLECSQKISSWPLPTYPRASPAKYMEITRIKVSQVENQLFEDALNTTIISKIFRKSMMTTPPDSVEVCNATHKFYTNRMLKYGRNAAAFTHLGRLDFENCALKCCLNKCDAVLHVNNSCYQVMCSSENFGCDVGNEFETTKSETNKTVSKLIIFGRKLNATNLRFDSSLENDESVEFFQLATYVEDMPPEENMGAVKDIVLPIVSGVRIGKIGSVMNEAGLILSTYGFEISTSKRTSLICPSTKDYQIEWPVTLINTTRTSSIDKLLQQMALDTQIESYSRRVKRNIHESGDELKQDSSDVLSRIFGSMGDIENECNHQIMQLRTATYSTTKKSKIVFLMQYFHRRSKKLIRSPKLPY
ncbi:hypothetical protein RF11_01611 [Thelohanellus kitauei]|uniref:MANSC domain-containing protein n=1 Tax=Thelohanellus kitauei TaxID=669202 RepID=A0A0C2JL87_THEKT|nr:hypothetical protein RF11_01611 [Thelohanellus kitauei]